jgi:hypothetical protein
MKYYLAEITEVNSGMEYNAMYLFATKGNPEKYADKVAMKWRGSKKSDWDESLNGYWSDNTLIQDGWCKEIPKEDFEVLNKYLTEM